MRRTDFTEAQRRELAWQRRKVCRAVGQAHDRLVDAGKDPSEIMEQMVGKLVEQVLEAEQGDEIRKAA